MTVLPTRVKMAEHVRMGSTATRVLVQQATLGKTVRQMSELIFSFALHKPIISLNYRYTKNKTYLGKTLFFLKCSEFSKQTIILTVSHFPTRIKVTIFLLLHIDDCAINPSQHVRACTNGIDRM